MPTPDFFRDRLSDANPAVRAVTVTPNDSLSTGDLLEPTRALWVGTTGDVAVVMAHNDPTPGGVVIYVGVQAGTLLPFSVIQVMATDTTAADFVAVY